jgi:GT2 family glycosyltransferase
MLVSFIISTYNRRHVLLQTLDRIGTLGLTESTYEIHVIDNASRDGTVEAVASLANISLHHQRSNRGACAKNVALPHARGKYLVFLDDDSYPDPGSIERMIVHFEQQPRLGAAGFNVNLPDGSQECSAFPNVFIGCGVGLRKSAIDEVGGLPVDFFMQAEEYDLSLRLLAAGWDVETFADLHVAHLKTPKARTPQRVMRLDVRNNLILIWRYLPRHWRIAFSVDWLNRYWLIACAKGQRRAFVTGALQGMFRALGARRRSISEEVLERFARFEQIRREMGAARDRYAARKILFIDLGKNMIAFKLAAEACGMQVVAIADNRLAGRYYRGIRILPDDEAERLAFDIAIVSNTSPVHARSRIAAWQSIDARPILDLLSQTPSSICGVAA